MPKINFFAKRRYLTKSQKGVLEDLFTAKLSEEEILEKWKVRRRTYNGWFRQPMFAAEFKRLVDIAQRKCELIFARYAAEVAAKMVSLAGAEKETIASKACMYVINYPERNLKKNVESKKEPEAEQLPELPPEMASRLLDALADERRIMDERRRMVNKDVSLKAG
jgi:hypothetical protein